MEDSKEKTRKYKSDWYQRNREAVLEKSRLYREQNLERVLGRQRRYNKSKYDRLRQAAIDILGGVCVRCGFNDIRALQIDHIDGGGNTERKARHLYSILAEAGEAGTEKYQLLCANCNQIKRHENGEIHRPYE